MTLSGWLLAAALLVLLLAAVLWKAPRWRRALPFYNHLRFGLLIALGKRPPLPFRDLYRGFFYEGDHDLRHERIRLAIAAGSRHLETDAQGFSLWEIPAGRFWIPPQTDPAFLFGVFAEQERNVYSMGGFGVRPGDVVVDCGANVGAFVHKALTSGARLVVAVEISPNTAECLRRNFASEIAAGRVVLYPKGMWHEESSLRLRVHPVNSGANTVVMEPEGSAEGPVVPLTTLDAMVGDLRLECVDFIKMDIEGAEQQALRGGRQTISRFHPRLALTCYHLPEDITRIPELACDGWPGYRISCGPCGIADRQIRPEILYFS